MTSPDDYGLAEILDTIGGVLYGGDLPECPGDKLNFWRRQRIAFECPQIVAAMLALRSQPFKERGIDDAGR